MSTQYSDHSISHLHNQSRNTNMQHTDFSDNEQSAIISKEQNLSHLRSLLKLSTNEHKPSTFIDFTEVFVWGDDSSGQLGLYHQKMKKGNIDQINFKVPKTCSFNIIIKQISCGDQHSAILTHQGHLYMMGSNVDGQLGIGRNLPQFQKKDIAGAPCLVDTLKDVFISQVVCGSNFTLAISPESTTLPEFQNSVYSWGCNAYGQIGQLNIKKVEYPTLISYFKENQIHLSSISAGRHHTLFVNEHGCVYSSGSNSHGQLGYETEQGYINGPKAIPYLANEQITNVCAGQYHSMFLTSKGEVLACGSNNVQQLGMPEIAVNQVFPLRIPTLVGQEITKIAANSHSAAVTKSGELFLWGTGVFGIYKTPQRILTISNKVKDVSLGQTLGAVVDCNGLLWTWGTNSFGELGVGDNDPRVHPYPVLTLKGKVVTQIQCGGGFVVALGSNLRKEIPNLKLKKLQKKSSSKSKSRQNNHNKHSSSKKKRTSSLNFLFRNQSSGSIKRQVDSPPPKPKSQKNAGLRKSVVVERNIPRQGKSSLRVKSSYPSQISKSKEDSMYHKAVDVSSVVNQKATNSSFVGSPARFQDLSKFRSTDMQGNSDLENAISGYNSAVNKEQKIRDFQTENKALKTELLHSRQDNKQLLVQIESLEKQLDRSRHSLGGSNGNGEVIHLVLELKKKESQLLKSKEKRKELEHVIMPMKDQIERVQREKAQLQDQINQNESHYVVLKEKLMGADQKNDQLQRELREFQKDVELIQIQSKQVEDGLMHQLQDLSEKYRSLQDQKEAIVSQQRLQQRTSECMQSQSKENSFYTVALEKENAFLREEIERVKYSKDKNEYKNFVQSLIKKKDNHSVQLVQSFDKTTTNFSPLKESQLSRGGIENMLNSTRKFEKEFLESQITQYSQKKVQQENIEPQTKEDPMQSLELKQSYNQKLLKSIEKKTLNQRQRCLI